MRFTKFPILACLLALMLNGAARGQSAFATITGNVTDPTGAAVAGATIEARNVNTGYVYTANSNEEGVYTLANLLDGTYTLKAKATGFGDFAVENIILAVRENRRIDVKLQVQAVSNFVDIAASGASLIETETARIADVKDREQLRALPLTLRRAWDYFRSRRRLTARRPVST